MNVHLGSQFVLIQLGHGSKPLGLLLAAIKRVYFDGHDRDDVVQSGKELMDELACYDKKTITPDRPQPEVQEGEKLYIQVVHSAFTDKYSPQHIHVSIEQETLLYHGHVHSLLSLKSVYARPATNIGTNDIITTMLNSTLTE